MSMTLRDKNFVSEIKHISIIQNSIKGLIGDDKYFFSTHVKGVTRVYYVLGVEDATGLELILFRDFTSYYTPNFNDPMNVAQEGDIAIKCITARTVGTFPLITEFAQDPGAAMAEYVTTYLDAMQTVTNF